MTKQADQLNQSNQPVPCGRRTLERDAAQLRDVQESVTRLAVFAQRPREPLRPAGRLSDRNLSVETIPNTVCGNRGIPGNVRSKTHTVRSSTPKKGLLKKLRLSSFSAFFSIKKNTPTHKRKGAKLIFTLSIPYTCSYLEHVTLVVLSGWDNNSSRFNERKTGALLECRRLKNTEIEEKVEKRARGSALKRSGFAINKIYIFYISKCHFCLQKLHDVGSTVCSDFAGISGEKRKLL